MKNLEFDVTINASAAKVWQVLWYDTTYRKWTSAFMEGSYAVSDWKEGSKVHFLSPDGNGMFSVIAECIPNERMAFTHLGVVKNFGEQPADDETKSWAGAQEIYILKEENGSTVLQASMNATDAFADYLSNAFPPALKMVKELAENPVVITIETTVQAPVDKVWKYWTTPDHITQWNNASDDWYTPAATNDLRKGGSFTFTMAARDGSFSFDFGGVYDEIKTNETIAYTMGDGRKANIGFSTEGNQTKVVESFEAEEANSLELQQGGWQNILNSFKKHTETN